MGTCTFRNRLLFLVVVAAAVDANNMKASHLRSAFRSGTVVTAEDTGQANLQAHHEHIKSKLLLNGKAGDILDNIFSFFSSEYHHVHVTHEIMKDVTRYLPGTFPGTAQVVHFDPESRMASETSVDTTNGVALDARRYTIHMHRTAPYGSFYEELVPVQYRLSREHLYATVLLHELTHISDDQHYGAPRSGTPTEQRQSLFWNLNAINREEYIAETKRIDDQCVELMDIYEKEARTNQMIRDHLEFFRKRIASYGCAKQLTEFDPVMSELTFYCFYQDVEKSNNFQLTKTCAKIRKLAHERLKIRNTPR